MLTRYSSNVIIGKARAMYGKRLKQEDYTALLACHTVSDVAAYLKAQTAYANALSGAGANEIHRGPLENYLHQKLFNDYASLCRYELSVGEQFADFLLISSEIEQILKGLLLTEAGKPQEYLFYMPAYLSRHTKISLVSLSQVKSFGGLLDALNGTPYRALLEKHRPIEGMPVDYSGIENELYTYLYHYISGMIGKRAHGEAQKELRGIFSTYADISNAVRMVRLKGSYQEGADVVRSLLLPYGSLPQHSLQELLDADADKIMDAFFHMRAGNRASKVEYSYLDQIPQRVRYQMCRHLIRFSTHSAVVMISYVFLMQAELMDIIHITEGIRYQLAPSEIQKLLTAV